MKKIFPFILILISFILQSTIFQFVKIFDVVPNISLILLVIFAVQFGEYYGGLLGIFIGILTDVMYVGFFGINTFIYFVIGYILGRFKDNVYKEDYLTYYTAVGIMTLLYNALFYIIIFFLQIETNSIVNMIKPVTVEIILNLILTYPLLRIEFKILEKMGVKLKYY
jgi:rod shape-determining protein MreD